MDSEFGGIKFRMVKGFACFKKIWPTVIYNAIINSSPEESI